MAVPGEPILLRKLITRVNTCYYEDLIHIFERNERIMFQEMNPKFVNSVIRVLKKDTQRLIIDTRNADSCPGFPSSRVFSESGILECSSFRE